MKKLFAINSQLLDSEYKDAHEFISLFKFNIKLNPNPKEFLKVNHETHSEKLSFFIS